MEDTGRRRSRRSSDSVVVHASASTLPPAPSSPGSHQRADATSPSNDDLVDPLAIDPSTVINRPQSSFPRWFKIVDDVRSAYADHQSKTGGEQQEVAAFAEPAQFLAWVSALIGKNTARWEVGDHQRHDLAAALHRELFGFGEMGLYLSDHQVEDIMLDRYNRLDILRDGKLMRITETPFRDDREVRDWLNQKVFSDAGKEFNASNPAENAMLKDGSRIVALTAPISPDTSFVIRRHRKEVFTDVRTYQATGIAPKQFFNDLNRWVNMRMNMVISGATGSGKTTFTNVAASLIPQDQRVVTLEDTRELQIDHPRIKSLLTYSDGARDKSSNEVEIPMSDLVRHALRMNPDRIIVGEVRGREAFDMLDALNTGHPGSFTTLHANSPVDAVKRLQLMCSRHEARATLGELDVNEMLAMVIDLVVQIKNLPEGRRVTAVHQVMFRPHFIDSPELLDRSDVHEHYPRIQTLPLWEWNTAERRLERHADLITPGGLHASAVAEHTSTEK